MLERVLESVDSYADHSLVGIFQPKTLQFIIHKWTNLDDFLNGHEQTETIDFCGFRSVLVYSF